MNRPSKKEIKASLDKLKDSKPAPPGLEYQDRKLEEKKQNIRIRKQGV